MRFTATIESSQSRYLHITKSHSERYRNIEQKIYNIALEKTAAHLT